MKKVLFIGANAYIQMVQAMGTAWQSAGYEVYSLHTPFIQGDFDAACKAAQSQRFDVVLGVLQYEPSQQTRTLLSLVGNALKLYWNFDDPYRIKTWPQPLEQTIPGWDAVISSSWEPWVQQWYEQRGLQFAYCYPPYYNAGLYDGFGNLWDVLFVGSNYDQHVASNMPYRRSDIITRMREEGMSVATFGYKFPMVLHEHHQAQFYCSARINLGQHIEQAQWLCFRDALVPGAGGFYLCDDNPGTMQLFGNDEVAYYSSVEEAVNKARYYLGHEEERKEVARRGWHKAQRLFSPQAVGQQLNAIVEKLRP